MTNDMLGPKRRDILRTGALGLAGMWGFTAGGLLAPQPTAAANPVAALDDPFGVMRQRLRDRLTGGQYDMSIPEVADAAQSLDDEAQTHLETIISDPDRTALWNDLDFTGSNREQIFDTRDSFQRLQQLAVVYASVGSRFHATPDLAAAIIDGLDWLNLHKYNENDGGGTGAWFHTQISIPRALTRTCVLTFDQLSAEQLGRYMAAVDRWCPAPSRTGANRIWTSTVVVERAILVEDEPKLARARDGINPVLRFVTTGDGFYEDGSFIQHGRHPYTGGYGVALLLQLSQFVAMLSGTPWQVTDTNLANIYDWVTDAFEPWLFRGALLSPVRGRNIARNRVGDHAAGHTAVEAIMNVAEFAPAERRTEFHGLVKRVIEQDAYLSFYEGPSIDRIMRGRTIAEDASIEPRPRPIRTRIFPIMDRAVHHRRAFAFALSMSSNRIYNYESINAENLRGWYTADGMHHIYNGDLSQYDDAFWPTVDPYRLPGTTVPVRPRADASGNRYRSPHTWVGGVELGEIGTAGMHFRTYPGESAAPDGRKSWFMFGDRVVFVGSGITSSGGHSVETVVENRKLTDPSAPLVVDNATVPNQPGWQSDLTGMTWAHLTGPTTDSSLGYVIPNASQLTAKREMRTGAWSDINKNTNWADDTPIDRPYFTMWIDHGIDPVDATYSWFLLPGATADEVQDFAAHPDIEVVANTPDVHAVRSGGLLAANVWTDEPITVNGLHCRGKAAVVVDHTGHQLAIAVADPTQSQATITLGVRRRVAQVTAIDPRVTVDATQPFLRVSVDVSGARGETVVARFTLRADDHE